jgi:lipopolysaccharide export system protein LptA
VARFFKLLFAGIFVVMSTGCFHVDDQKYRQIYLKSFSKPVEKINQQGFEEAETPTPSVFGMEKAAVTTPVLQQAKTVAPTPAAAAPETKNQEGQPNKIRQIDISSDNLSYNKQSEFAVFKGHVVAITSDIIMHCDTLSAKNYQKDADAEGNIRVTYKKQKVKMKCDKLKYTDNMNVITGYDNVVAEKKLEDGNTLTIYADQIQFDTVNNIIIADKKTKKVKMEMKDVLAFADKVVYNEKENKVYMKGKPFVRKKSSSFLADIIVLDVEKKSIRLKSNIWSKLFYAEFENTQKEVESETSKDKPPGKNIQ